MDEELLVLERRRKLWVDIHILLVDDDSTSLAVVSAMLRLCNYQVVTLKNPIEALDTLRSRKGFFDLVLTDLHMPQMNGLQLQKQVIKEFKLPVIMMSADENPSVILKSLEEGVAFYMVKPITLDDVKHVWQYAITAKKVITPNQTTSTIVLQELSSEKSLSSSAPCSKKEIIQSKLDAKSKNKKGKENRVTKKSIAIRKAKVIWTNSLHNRFLQAIRLIGLDKAVPKKILEFMNVPGLTRENVASHLQKYRIFLQRVAEKGTHRSMKTYSDYTLLRSSFASPHFQPSFYTSKFQSHYPYSFPKKQQLMAPNLNYQCPIILLGANNLSYIAPPNPNIEGASMEKSMPHLDNQKYSSLFTINKLPKFPFNGLISSSAQDDQNFVSMENENTTCSSNGRTRGITMSTGENRMSCSGKDGVCNVQAPHDLKKGGLGLNGGAFCRTFEGTNQLLQMICNNNMEENGSVLVSSSSSSEEVNNVNTRKATNDTMGFGDIGCEDQNCFDVLSEIFKGHNHNQTSLRKEEMIDIDLSDIWNGIEMDDASSPKQDLQPSGLYAQGWDDDILEIFSGDGSLS